MKWKEGLTLTPIHKRESRLAYEQMGVILEDLYNDTDALPTVAAKAILWCIENNYLKTNKYE